MNPFSDQIWQYLSDQSIEESDNILRFSVNDEGVGVEFFLSRKGEINVIDVQNQDIDDAFSMADDFIEELVEDFHMEYDESDDYEMGLLGEDDEF